MVAHYHKTDKIAAHVRSLKLPLNGRASAAWQGALSDTNQCVLLRGIIVVLLDIDEQPYKDLTANVAFYNFIRLADYVKDESKNLTILRAVVDDISTKYRAFIEGQK